MYEYITHMDVYVYQYKYVTHMSSVWLGVLSRAISIARALLYCCWIALFHKLSSAGASRNQEVTLVVTHKARERVRLPLLCWVLSLHSVFFCNCNSCKVGISEKDFGHQREGIRHSWSWPLAPTTWRQGVLSSTLFTSILCSFPTLVFPALYSLGRSKCLRPTDLVLGYAMCFDQCNPCSD